MFVLKQLKNVNRDVKIRKRKINIFPRLNYYFLFMLLIFWCQILFPTAYHYFHGGPSGCPPVHGHPLVDHVCHGSHNLCKNKMQKCRQQQSINDQTVDGATITLRTCWRTILKGVHTLRWTCTILYIIHTNRKLEIGSRWSFSEKIQLSRKSWTQLKDDNKSSKRLWWKWPVQKCIQPICENYSSPDVWAGTSCWDLMW